MSDDWGRLCAVGASLAEKRAALEGWHRGHMMEFIDGLVDLGELPSDQRDVALSLAMEKLQPVIDADVARLFGREALH